MNEMIDYIANCICGEIFTVADGGMEYGVGKRSVINANNGVFGADLIKALIKSKMDDKDIYDDIGGIGFDYILKNIPEVSKKCLKIIKSGIEPEAEHFKTHYLEVYTNCVNSLERIAQ